MNSIDIKPVLPKERYLILDILRGLALFGIGIANFPEFSLYTFLNSESVLAMPTAGMDRILKYLLTIFIDGKFYTMFSILFGMGFSIIISNVMRRQENGFPIFYRRMSILFIMGFLHLMFVWSGDILMLYALLGMILPLFRHVSNKGLLLASASLLMFPIIMEVIISVSGFSPSAPVVSMQQYFCAKYGITEDNFAFWLRDAHHYGDVFSFLVQGAFVRMQEFIEGNRYFKVMGLFLLGFYIGRNRLYANLDSNKKLFVRVFKYGMVIGLPASLFYAWHALNAYPWGQVSHSVLYTVSVFPLGLAYMAGICLVYRRHRESVIFKVLAKPGQMALTNYIGQSLCGAFIFYGIGLGLGATIGLIHVVWITIGVYLVEILFSNIWLRYCQFGPLEWIWRMLTYKKRLPLFISPSLHISEQQVTNSLKNRHS